MTTFYCHHHRVSKPKGTLELQPLPLEVRQPRLKQLSLRPLRLFFLGSKSRKAGPQTQVTWLPVPSFPLLLHCTESQIARLFLIQSHFFCINIFPPSVEQDLGEPLLNCHLSLFHFLQSSQGLLSTILNGLFLFHYSMWTLFNSRALLII